MLLKPRLVLCVTLLATIAMGIGMAINAHIAALNTNESYNDLVLDQTVRLTICEVMVIVAMRYEIRLYKRRIKALTTASTRQRYWNE